MTPEEITRWGERLKEPWDTFEGDENHVCSVCKAPWDDMFIYLTVSTSPGEEGYGEVTQCLCDIHYQQVVHVLRELGFKSHAHHGINFLETDECGGYGKCLNPCEYGPELAQ